MSLYSSLRWFSQCQRGIHIFTQIMLYIENLFKTTRFSKIWPNDHIEEYTLILTLPYPKRVEQRENCLQNETILNQRAHIMLKNWVGAKTVITWIHTLRRWYKKLDIWPEIADQLYPAVRSRPAPARCSQPAISGQDQIRARAMAGARARTRIPDEKLLCSIY